MQALSLLINFILARSYLVCRKTPRLQQSRVGILRSTPDACRTCIAGLANGVLLRTEVDRVAGTLSDTRTRFLGTKPPKLFAAKVGGARCMLALSSRPWLGYSDMGRYTLTPLSYEALDYAWGGTTKPLPLPSHALSVSIRMLVMTLASRRV